MQLSMVILFMLFCCAANKYVVSSDESENIIENEISTTDNIKDSRIQSEEFSNEMDYSDEKDEEKLFIEDIQRLANITTVDEIRRKAANYRIQLKDFRMKNVPKLKKYIVIKSRKTILESELSELQLLIWLERMLKEYREDFDLYEWTEMTPSFVANKALIKLHASIDDKNKEYERQQWLFFLNNPPNDRIRKLKEFMDNHSDLICIEDFSYVVSEFHSRIMKFQKIVSQCGEALTQPLEIFMFDNAEDNFAILLLMQDVSVPEKIKVMVRKEFQSKPSLMLMSFDVFKI